MLKRSKYTRKLVKRVWIRYGLLCRFQMHEHLVCACALLKIELCPHLNNVDCRIVPNCIFDFEYRPNIDAVEAEFKQVGYFRCGT